MVVGASKFFSDFFLEFHPPFPFLDELVLQLFELRLTVLCFSEVCPTELCELFESVSDGICKVFNLNIMIAFLYDVSLRLL